MEKPKNHCLIISNSDISAHPTLEEITAIVGVHRGTLPDQIQQFSDYVHKNFPKVYVEVCEKQLAQFIKSEADAFDFAKDKNVLRMFDVVARISVEHFAACLFFFQESDIRYTTKKGKWEKEPLLKKKRFFHFFKVLRELREGFVNTRDIPEDELYVQPRTGKRWADIDNITTVIEPATKEKCLESTYKRCLASLALWGAVGKEAQFLPKTENDMDIIMEKFSKYPDILHAKGIEFKDKIDQDNRDNCDDVGFRFLIRMNHYKNNEVKCLTDGLFMIAQAPNQLARRMFNFLEKGVVKFFRKKLEYPSVEHNIKLYLKPDILDRFFTSDKRSPIKVKSSSMELNEEELLPVTLTVKDPNAIRIRFFCDSKLKQFESRIKSTTSAKGSKGSPTKSASPPKFKLDEHRTAFQQESRISADCEVTQQWLEANETSLFDNVLIYIHGGGFVAMSSSSHQNYLLKWAKELKLPIFGIDYRLAPDAKYPDLPNDVFRSYVWILAFLTEVLKVNPKKIIVSGDSAGGNLSAILTTWCIENKVRKPDFVLMSYPATDLNSKRFTPSLVYSMGDFLLNFNGLRMCESYYMPEWVKPKEDYYLSPVVTPTSVLAQYPSCAILVTERDPLNDDGFRFAEKIKNAGAKISVYYFRHVIHGQLNFALTNDQGLPEAHKFEEVARNLLSGVMVGMKLPENKSSK